MEDTTTYAWHSTYLAAVLETEQAQMPARIAYAMQSLQSRLQNPADISSEERTAIENATKALTTLSAERGELKPS